MFAGRVLVFQTGLTTVAGICQLGEGASLEPAILHLYRSVIEGKGIADIPAGNIDGLGQTSFAHIFIYHMVSNFSTLVFLRPIVDATSANNGIGVLFNEFGQNECYDATGLNQLITIKTGLLNGLISSLFYILLEIRRCLFLYC